MSNYPDDVTQASFDRAHNELGPGCEWCNRGMGFEGQVPCGVCGFDPDPDPLDEPIDPDQCL